MKQPVLFVAATALGFVAVVPAAAQDANAQPGAAIFSAQKCIMCRSFRR